MRLTHAATICDRFKFVCSSIKYWLNSSDQDGQIVALTMRLFPTADQYYAAHPVVERILKIACNREVFSNLSLAISAINDKYAAGRAIMYSTEIHLLNGDETLRHVRSSKYISDVIPTTSLLPYLNWPLITKDHLGTYWYVVCGSTCEEITPEHKFWYVALEI